MEEEKQNSSKLTIFAFLAIVAMAFLVVFTNSKFQTALGSTRDSARVAFFLGDGGFTYDLQGKELAPGEEYKVVIAVSNQKNARVTEVATKYTISLDTYGALSTPLEYELSGEGTTTNLKTDAKVAEMPPGTAGPATRTYILTITWPEDQNAISYANQLGVSRLVFKAEQID